MYDSSVSTLVSAFSQLQTLAAQFCSRPSAIRPEGRHHVNPMIGAQPDEARMLVDLVSRLDEFQEVLSRQHQTRCQACQ